ncbi:uncharacterized protein LOC106462200 [Limulus polyphemus]|uniref:Uncharacterized protein LOC106462200 n=1 Tax=Limulus polyphemus TaxID=6850 RepID=A0ABM1B9H8_LIMPO|nr:uncharacterized protein LOC106462200 [Limulus polyphemus]
MKKISDTRWSARSDAILSLKQGYHDIKNALLDIAVAENEKPVAKVEAKAPSKKFEKYENAVLTVLWNRLLQRMNAVSKSLQSKDGYLFMAVELLTSLQAFITEVRNDYSSIELEALSLTKGVVILDENLNKNRLKKSKTFCDELQEKETMIEGKQKWIIETVIR